MRDRLQSSHTLSRRTFLAATAGAAGATIGFEALAQPASVAFDSGGALYATGFDLGLGPLELAGHSASKSIGKDALTGFSWPPQVWGGGGRGYLHHILGTTVGSAADITTNQTSQIEPTSGRDGGSALYTELATLKGSSPQVLAYHLPNKAGQPPDAELYVRQVIKLRSETFARMGPNNWLTLFEWKTPDPDTYRMCWYIYTALNGLPYFMLVHDDWTTGRSVEHWHDRSPIQVPAAGTWMECECYFKRGDPGRAWMRVNGAVAHDVAAGVAPIDQAAHPIDRIMYALTYGGFAPIGRWTDHIAVHATLPPGVALSPHPPRA